MFLERAGFEVSSVPYFDRDDVPAIEDLADETARAIQPDQMLVGYSAGGRIALEAMLRGARPRAAVIVSAGLGIEDENARVARFAADDQWAARFESEAWKPLMRDWNAQSVFSGHVMPRDERLYRRRGLAAALRRWSPAVQIPLAPRLHTIDVRTMWVVGSRDRHYLQEARRALLLLPRAELMVLEGAGHRVPWESPDAFIACLRAFVD